MKYPEISSQLNKLKHHKFLHAYKLHIFYHKLVQNTQKKMKFIQYLKYNVYIYKISTYNEVPWKEKQQPWILVT